MAYRSLSLLGALVVAGPAVAAPAAPKVALIVDGGGDHHDELQSALSKSLGAEVATPATAPSDDAGLKALRLELKATRVVILRVVEQGRGSFTLEARAADSDGVAHRFSDASAGDLLARSQALIAQLPPIPVEEAKPPPVAETKPPVEEAKPPEAAAPPPAAAVEPTATPPRKQHPRWVKRHPYDLLIAGAVTFLLPYFTTVGFAVAYQGYNPNAGSAGYIPLAGPFLARQRINDKDLRDGYDPGLLVDGIVQVLTFNVLIAGIIYCAVGEKRLDYRDGRGDRVQVQPLLGAGRGRASVGAMVTW